MKFLHFAFVLGSLAGSAFSHPHPEPASDIARSDAVETRFEPVLKPADVEKRTNTFPVPAGKDGTKLQVWLRLDTTPHEWLDRDGVTYANLNHVLKLMGGKHKDVIIATATTQTEMGLMWGDSSWKTHDDADGTPIEAYHEDYQHISGERLTYIGQITSSRINLGRIEAKREFSIYAFFSCVLFGRGRIRNHRQWPRAEFIEVEAQDMLTYL